MKKSLSAALLALGLTFNWILSAHAEDLTDRLELSGIAQAAWPLGQHSVTDQTKKVGTDFGAMVGYGVNQHLSLALSYDNVYLQNNFRMQPFMFNGIYRLYSDRKWTPNAQLGVGVVKGFSDASYDHVSAKAGLGAEYFLCSNFSFGPQVTYILADDQTKDKEFAHVITAGMVANLFFGGPSAAPAPVATQAAAPPPPPPVPVPAVIVIVMSPSETTLGPGGAQHHTATVSGTDNQGVTFAISPNLGSITQNGDYTAPTTIAFAEIVTVTATSVADGTKVATSHIKLNPPAEAPKEVSIRMDVLFDTNKTNIKPQYDGEISKVAEFMKSYPDTKAEIDGFTDSVGASQYNHGLSQRRADSVKDYMMQKFGIAANRLSAKGYGEEKPIASNDTAAGRAQNRRVVAVLTAQQQ